MYANVGRKPVLNTAARVIWILLVWLATLGLVV